MNMKHVLASSAAALTIAAGLYTGIAVAQDDAPLGLNSTERPQRGYCRSGEKAGPGRFGGAEARGPRPPRIEEIDTDGDGAVSRSEAEAMPMYSEERFYQLDANNDGFITEDERPERRDRGQRPPRFEEIDTDGDGAWSVAEVAGLPPFISDRFGELDADGDGLRGGPPTFAELDENGDGKLSLSEASVIPPMTTERFNAFDADGDGYLSESELPPPPQHRRGDRRGGFGEGGARGPRGFGGPPRS